MLNFDRFDKKGEISRTFYIHNNKSDKGHILTSETATQKRYAYTFYLDTKFRGQRQHIKHELIISKINNDIRALGKWQNGEQNYNNLLECELNKTLFPL